MRLVFPSAFVYFCGSAAAAASLSNVHTMSTQSSALLSISQDQRYFPVMTRTAGALPRLGVVSLYLLGAATTVVRHADAQYSSRDCNEFNVACCEYSV